MKIYISGLYSGPNPSPGVGTARSLRAAYPEASLVGVDYSNRSLGLHWPDFDEVWLQRPWTELNLDEYELQIRNILDSGALWISGLDIESIWLARALANHPGLLIPSPNSLNRIAKPAITAHDGLPVKIPPFISTAHSDWEIFAFCRQHGWPVWVKAPYYEARRALSWHELNLARSELAHMWSTDELFIQAHITGYEESVVMCSYRGTLLGHAYMTKRDITPEGKTWAGRISGVPDEIVNPLREIVEDLLWTGGAELEMIRDLAGNLWLIEWNPRFPAWIHGASIAGNNLPSILIARATGIPARKTEATSQGFVRVVLELPSRSEFPLPPLPEPISRYSRHSLKHPSGMPALAKRLQEPSGASIGSSSNCPSTLSISPRMIKDISARDLSHVQTPYWLFLETTAQSAFKGATNHAKKISTSSVEVAIAYSMKTNPDVRFLELARRHGLLLETISQLEIQKALSEGFAADQIILNGPGKWWPAEEVISHPLRAVFCDSPEELKLTISKIGNGANPAYVIGVRIRPPQIYSRFGIPVGCYEVFQELVSLVADLPTEYRFGIHFHIASSAIGIQQWQQLYESLLTWSYAIETVSGRKIECLDIGGGWFPDDWSERFEARFRDVVFRASSKLTHVSQVILEPGKALVQPAMALAMRVLEVRRSQHQVEEVIVDGSISELPEIPSYPHRILILDPRTDEWQPLKHGYARLSGRLCMENDILATNVSFPNSVAIGDIVVVCDAGAYDRSMSYVFAQG